MSDVTRIVVCDDQGMVRAGFKSLLEAEPDLEVVGEASNGQEAIDIVSLLQPDVTLMDIRMPVLDGLAATRHLVEAGVPTSVLVLTTFDLDEYVFEALRAGASGFLLKDAPASELAGAIRRVVAGERIVDPGLAAAALAEGESPLTAREHEVLEAARRYGTVAELADALHLSPGTTRNHLSAIMGKLGAHSRIEAIRVAEEKGWL